MSNERYWPPWSMLPIRTSYPRWTLLGGMPYRSSVNTNVLETFRKERERIERERARQRRMAEERDG